MSEFDGMLLAMAQKHHGIDGLMETFFDFLGRRTDFFTGAGRDRAKATVLKHFKAAQKRYAPAEPRKTKTAPKPAAAPAPAPAASTTTTTGAAKPEARGIEEIESDDDAETMAGEADIGTPAPAPAPEPAVSPVDEEDEEGGLVPNAGNGADLPGYSWTQTLRDVDVVVPLAPAGSGKRFRGRDVAVTIKRSSISIGVRGQPAILSGELPHDVHVDDSLWVIEEGRLVCVTLQKKETQRWWKSVVKGEPEINSAKVAPENTQLSDLDSETRGMVEKMMFDQRAKAAGMPTSDDIQKQEALRKFMAQHPEMDFSNAKIS